MSDEKPMAVFPLKTPRLLLRPFVASDATERFRLDSEPAVQRYLGEPTSEQRSRNALMRDIESFERQGYGAVAVVEADSGKMVGFAAVQQEPSQNRLELVIALEPRAQRRGFGTEITEALVHMAWRHLGAVEIVGRVDPTNAESSKLVAKLGMRRVEDRVDPLSGKTEHVSSLSCEAWLEGRMAAR